MRTVDEYEEIRKAYYLEGMSIREISKRLHHGRVLIRKALDQAEPAKYRTRVPRAAPVLAPYKSKIDALILESEQMPRKQRYTGHKIYQLLRAEGYQGSEGNVHHYVSQQRRGRKQKQAYLPLEFEPGQDAQVDWGEVLVELQGVQQKVQIFVMRLNHSRARFVMAFPFQKQEAFFEGHVQAFHFFQGVPHRITYDNLKTAVFRVLEGHNRQEQRAFTAFRSYYLFESQYCTPAQGHEKGGVESDVGYAQRNFFAPLARFGDFASLNDYLRHACLDDMQRRVRGENHLVAEVWQAEKAALLPVPAAAYQACTSHVVKVNPYSQVVFETNRYSVPAEYAGKQMVLCAYPFSVKIVYLDQVVAEHERCFGREQDVLNPLHYLGLLEQRPGAFEHAVPIRQWRRNWPAYYNDLLAALRQSRPNGSGIREFIAILKMHRVYPEEVVNQAVQQAVNMGAPHLDGVLLCLRQMVNPLVVPQTLEIAHPELAALGTQPLSLEQYNQLLMPR